MTRLLPLIRTPRLLPAFFYHQSQATLLDHLLLAVILQTAWHLRCLAKEIQSWWAHNACQPSPLLWLR